MDFFGSLFNTDTSAITQPISFDPGTQLPGEPLQPTVELAPPPDFGTGAGLEAQDALGIGAGAAVVVAGIALLVFSVPVGAALGIALVAGLIVAAVAWSFGSRSPLPSLFRDMFRNIPAPVAKALVTVASAFVLYMLVAFLFAGWTPLRSLREFRAFVKRTIK